MSSDDRGPKYVSGEVVDGRVYLTREDGTTSQAPVLLLLGYLVDNGNGTYTVNLD